MTAPLLALASSFAYGAADFLGGAAARGAHVLRVVIIAAPASLLVELLIWPAPAHAFLPARSPGALHQGWRRQPRSRCCTAPWPSAR